MSRELTATILKSATAREDCTNNFKRFIDSKWARPEVTRAQAQMRRTAQYKHRQTERCHSNKECLSLRKPMCHEQSASRELSSWWMTSNIGPAGTIIPDCKLKNDMFLPVSFTL